MNETAGRGEVARIRDLHRRAFEGEAWHGPDVHALLEGVGWEAAVARPVAHAHSILEIVLHIGAWEDAVARRLVASDSIELSPDEDWERPDFTEAGWDDARRKLEKARLALDAALARLPEERLGDTVPGKDYDVYVMLHGVVEHTLYHAGQIAIVKKALAAPP